MNIGYSVQGSTDRAFLRGLHKRWCPRANLIEGRFRGSTSESLRREYRQICEEFVAKSVDVMIFLTDADDRVWKDVQRDERANFPQDRLVMAVHGVADRNVECWICLNTQYVAENLGINAADLGVLDPKGRFESAIGIDRDDKQEDRIAGLVRGAPLGSWLASESFEDFYEQLRDRSQLLNCEIENIRNA